MLGGEATMELLRTITYQPAAGSKMCEQALGKACGGDSKKKRPQQPSEDGQPQTQVTAAATHHHHHHSHSGPEISRIIVDPTTGKRYCRGKVLGKVRNGGRASGCGAGGRAARARQVGWDSEPSLLAPSAVWSPARRGSLTCPSGLLRADSHWGSALYPQTRFSSRGGLKAVHLRPSSHHLIPGKLACQISCEAISHPLPLPLPSLHL